MKFIRLWGFADFPLYSMRRVECGVCGVVVEEVPWSHGKHQLTKAYMLLLACWARKLSWMETAEAFHTSWDKVCEAVEYVVGWGLEHRTLESICAIGVDEIQYANGQKYLTLVYTCAHKSRDIAGYPHAGLLGNAVVPATDPFLFSSFFVDPYVPLFMHTCISYVDDFRILASLCLACAPTVFAMKKIRGRRRSSMAH